MGVLTEHALRSKLRNENIKEYVIDKSVIVTPSARQYLSDKNIKLVVREDKKEEQSKEKTEENKEKRFTPKYEVLGGGFFENKPEFMTQLYGNKLVYKDHSKIVLRGKFDSMQSKVLSTQIIAKKLGEKKVLQDLEEILKFIRDLMLAEILNKNFETEVLLGMNEQELRAISHNPKKYLGTDHIFYASHELGEMPIALNELRSSIREVEICALKAFKNSEGEVDRLDIMRALNRLSSCFYIMMCKYVAGKYK